MATTAFSLRLRVKLCLVMLALESFISYEEIFMVSVLQRLGVPVALVSLPGTISSVVGIFVIPLLGWASDRFTSRNCCGNKRPYALLTLTVCIMGASILFGVTLTSLYSKPLDVHHPQNASDSNDPYSNSDKNVSKTDESSGTTPNDSYNLILVTSQSSALLKNSSALEDSNSTLGSGVIEDLAFLVSTRTSAVVTADHNGTALDNSSNSASHIPALGILGIVGFVLADHGYDSSMSTFKVYMIAVTPSVQHDEVFVMGTLIGAIGGCVTSLLGFVNLASLFPSQGTDSVLDTWVAQCLVQTGILWLSLVVLGSVSLMTGSETTAETQVGKTSRESSVDKHNDDLSSSSSSSICESGAPEPQKMPSAPNSRGPSKNNGHSYQSDEKSRLIMESNTSSSRDCKSMKKKVLLCTMTFLGLCTNYSYFVYVTNYVGVVIYGGDSHADAESDAYRKYVEGEHMASLGMLTFYILYVGFNLLHNKILKKIGMRAEYLGSSVLCCVVLLSLSLTDSLVVFFLNAAAMALFRSAVYTVPFIVSNNYALQEESTEHGRDGASGSSSGSSMASIAAMIPASYFLVSLVMGPIMDATGYPGAPIMFATVSCALGVVSTFFVQF